MKVKGSLLIWIILIAFPLTLHSQDSSKKADWLPKGNLFPTQRLDFRESQVSGGMYGFYVSGAWQNRAFATFSAGFRRNVIRWFHKNERASELGFELCVFPQFIFEKPFETFLVNFFNIDFKVGMHYQYKINSHWRLRARIYHVSAHLGDDYIRRYEIERYTRNTRVFEMIDFSASWLKGPFMAYGNLGCFIHSTYSRLPLLLQLGGQWKRASKKIPWFQWIAGIDIRSEQETSFRPCFHAGAGVVLGKEDRFPVTVMIDYYNGNIPYSLYNLVFIQWIGASVYFDVF
jgi:hypothetical protein